MTIRQGIPSDEADIRKCANEAYQQYIEVIGKSPAPMHADFKSQLEEGHIQVAIDKQNTLIGYICFYQKGNTVQLESIAVSNIATGQGIGRKLIEVCEVNARKLGAKCIELYTNEKMESNLSLYPYLGYTECNRKKEDGFYRVYFKKALSQPENKQS